MYELNERYVQYIFNWDMVLRFRQKGMLQGTLEL